MRMKAGFAGAAVILLGTFLFLNWRTLALPADFNFLVGTISMPTGVLIVGFLLLVTLVFSVYVALWQHRVLDDYRRQSRELRTQRELADAAETSRLTALGIEIRGHFDRTETRLGAEIGALRAEVNGSERSLAAMIAELDDRLSHGGRLAQ
jgi:uncharacterized integral membrane protein